MKYRIVDAKESNISGIRGLNQSLLDVNYTAKWWREKLKENSPFIVAFSDTSSKPVGYIATYPTSTNDWVIFSVAVSKQHQNNGVCTMMLSDIICRAKSMDINIHLHVRTSNEKAVHIYKDKFGFINSRVVSNYYQDGTDAYKMILIHQV
jgi:ribosomal protein S18 acetylase RimI-like enzyme